jgi:RNA polymerase sigma-70 factor (ECF subfamily)
VNGRGGRITSPAPIRSVAAGCDARPRRVAARQLSSPRVRKIASAATIFVTMDETPEFPTTVLTGEGDAARPPGLDWDAVLADHGHWLRRLVAARLGEPQAVDEVMQDVALAVVSQSRQPKWSRPAHLVGWLYRLTVRQVLIHRRKAGRRRGLIDRYANRGGAVDVERRDEPSPLAWLLLDERRQIVRDALRRLPPRDADLLILKYAEDWTARELARRLNLEIATVEARLHRARRKLRAELASLAADFEETSHDPS